MSKYGRKRCCSVCKTLYYDFNKGYTRCFECRPVEKFATSPVLRAETNLSKRKTENAKGCNLELVHFDAFDGKDAKTILGKKIKLPKSCSTSGFYLTALGAIKKGIIKNKNELVFLGKAPLTGLQRYLAGKKFKGVGEVRALGFTREFKEESFEILASEEHLKTKLPEKSKKLIEEMRVSWQENKKINFYHVFLLELGFSDSQINDMSENFGDKIVKTLNIQPFSLIQKIKRLSFLDLEHIFKRLSISISDIPFL